MSQNYVFIPQNCILSILTYAVEPKNIIFCYHQIGTIIANFLVQEMRT